MVKSFDLLILFTVTYHKALLDCQEFVCILFHSIFRCTLNAIPQTSSLLNKARLPLGILIHPFKDLSVSISMFSTEHFLLRYLTFYSLKKIPSYTQSLLVYLQANRLKPAPPHLTLKHLAWFQRPTHFLFAMFMKLPAMKAFNNIAS